MPTILAINAGSSSLKFALTQGPSLTRVAAGTFERVLDAPQLTLKGPGAAAKFKVGGSGHQACLSHLLELLNESRLLPDIVVHRVVHGGNHFSTPQLLTPEALEVLESLTRLAPLHQPYNLLGVRAAQHAFPHAQQVACFDTAFHQTAPAEFRRFALPLELHQQGIQPYGFHGLSYEYVSRQPVVKEFSRVVIAHLGSGASVCAVRDGRSVSSSMGFTALDGLVMGTRCGSLDAGVVLHLVKSGWSADALEKLLYKESGLKALSEGNADVRDIEARALSGDTVAENALGMWANSIAEHITRMACRMRGMDALVFTAGVGENSAYVRKLVAQRLAFLGVRISDAANEAGTSEISDEDSALSVLIVPTNEEAQMAQNALMMLAPQ